MRPKDSPLTALLPINEKERLEALHEYEILDTDAEESFDDITQLASQICETPMASISFVDDKSQWFKSRVGIIASETARDIAFCAHTILGKDLFEVEDAQAGERFAANPLVTGDPHLRFYAGAPLIMPDGHVLGRYALLIRCPEN